MEFQVQEPQFESKPVQEVDYVDATKLNDYLQCIRLGYWRHERSLVPIQPQLPLVYGISIHAALAAFYRGGDTRDMIKAFDSEWGPRAMGMEDTKRNPKQGLKTIIAYADLHRHETWKVLGVEMPGLMPLTPTFTWTMIIDLLVESNGRIFPVDHKTTSFFNEGFWAGMNPNHQFTGYMTGIRAVSGHKVNMLMVNGVLVTKTEPKFERQVTTRHPKEIERWQDEILAFWVHSVLPNKQTGIWPRNPDRCQRWFGGCPYHLLCTTVSIDYMEEEPSEELYRKEVWDPLQKIEEVKKHGNSL